MKTTYQCACRTRRQMLGWAALAALGAAGCSRTEEAASLAPVEIDRSTSCELDGMLLADYPGPKAQIHYANQAHPSFFCDTVELFNVLLAGVLALLMRAQLAAPMLEILPQGTLVSGWIETPLL